MANQTVQLVNGRDLALQAGDPRPIARRFGLLGEVAVIDLDAALGRGSNREVIADLLDLARCRVGGGIRTAADARRWLDAGAAKVILGTAATPSILRELPPERVIAALDVNRGEVVVEGWRRGTGRTVLDRITELRGLVGGFLVTFVEQEGMLQGTRLDLVPEIVSAAEGARVTIAGGVTTSNDILMLDRMGADAQVGMALYTGRLGLADAFAAPLVSDRGDGLWPTVIVDELGTALGLAYSNSESLRLAIDRARGVYYSRSRRNLWKKGEQSGCTQELIRIDADCDRDTLRFTVRQRGPGFCHNGTATCWGRAGGLSGLDRLLRDRTAAAPSGSYVARLLADPALLARKLAEECGELTAAATADEAVREAADVLFFALVSLRARGGALADVAAELDRRHGVVTRRPGDAKPLISPSRTCPEARR
ncbi:MAG: phosphoribosyl-ATP diphosphatase [Phycisphaerales bacterium]|nr:phosphoribosyl-ATP diphosphatase [Phycisphaerales bacterium]